ncbi:hypothetical protein ACLB2K_063070 [Fragaria x ananassa]
MVLLAAANSFGNATIPTAEATALRDSRVEAKDQGFSNIQVEGDSKLVIDAINGRISTYTLEASQDHSRHQDDRNVFYIH